LGQTSPCPTRRGVLANEHATAPRFEIRLAGKPNAMSEAEDPSSRSRSLDEAVERATTRAIERLDDAEREEYEQRVKEDPERSESSQQRDALAHRGRRSRDAET
jgi:hypothetical protein